METVYKDLNIKLKTQLFFSNHESKIDTLSHIAQFGDVIRVKGKCIHFFINDPDTINKVLVTHADNYSKIATSSIDIRDMLGTGLLTKYGEDWQESNKKIKSSFYHNNLSQCVTIINDYTDKMLDQWEKFADKRRDVNIAEEMSKLILQTSSALLFGQKLPADPKKAVKIIQYGNEYIATTKNIWKFKPTFRNWRYQHAKKFIDNTCYQLLSYPHNQFEGLTPLLEPFFLSDSATPTEIEQAIGEAKNFLIAGHETTALALTWAFYCLSKSPFFYEALHNEVDEILEGSDPTFENYNTLSLTQKIIQESIRLFPPIWSMERTALEDDQFGPMDVPKGSKVFICTYTMHRNPQYWEDPDVFNPHRFNEENAKNRPKCAYIPFSTGKRVCVGKHLAMLMTTCVLAKVAQRYHFRLEYDQNIITNPLISLRPYPDVKLRIQRK